jgi:peptidoglycan DL-endopeptidase CwlO
VAHSARLRMAVAGALVGLLTIAVSATPAGADPASVGEIEARINKVWQDAEPLIEKYNAVHEKYQKNKAKQADLLRKMAPLQRQVDLAQLRVGVIAAQIYRGGNADAFNAVVSSGSPKKLAEQLTYLQYFARGQQRQIAGVTAMVDEYDALKAPIDAVVAELAKQDADLKAKRKVIDAKLAELQRLRLQAYGTTAGTGSYRPWPCPSEYAPTKGYKAAVFACKQAGDAYVYGASGPNSYDCSGLTSTAWSQTGVYLPHNAERQRSSMPYVKRENLQVGDLVFYYGDLHHVAIYVGNGKVMHAPNSLDRVRMRVLEDVGPVHSYGRPR